MSVQGQQRLDGDWAQESTSRRSRILIVEDERHIARLLDYFLSKAGYEVRVVNDAEEALTVIEGYEPDALLLDLVLPGMSGLDFLAAVRDQLKRTELVVIVLSAHWFAPDDPTLANAGATAQCAKPVAPTTLMRKLQELGIHPQQLAPRTSIPAQPEEEGRR